MRRQSLIALVGILSGWLEECQKERKESATPMHAAMLGGKCKAYTDAIVLIESRIEHCPHERAAKLAMAGKPDLDAADKARMQSWLAADAARIESLERANTRLREVAAFLAESIENPTMKTQTEALAAWKELNK